MHIICTICTDVITQDDLQSMYVTSCGHVFHYHCLTQWTERSPSCPQCRNKITNKLMFRVYLTLSEEAKHDNVLMETLLKTQVQLNSIIKERDDEIAEAQAKLEDRERMITEYEKAFEKNERVIAKMKQKLAVSKKQTDETLRLSLENTKLRERLMDLSMKRNNKKNDRKQFKRNDERKPAKKRQHKQYNNSMAVNHKRRSKDSNGNLKDGSSDSMLESSNSSISSESASESGSSGSDSCSE